MPSYPGDLEQMVLLSVLQLGEEAHAVRVLEELDARAGRRVSRGTIYKTMERLEAKGLVAWEVEEAETGRGGNPRRRFEVTPEGVRTLQASRDALFRLWDGLDHVLGEPNG